MYHWVIALGLVCGLGEILLGGMWSGSEALGVAAEKAAAGGSCEGFVIEVLGFFGRVIGTCAVLYGFFLCRMLGAGDIKLMAVCVGSLGVRQGVSVIAGGLILALLVAAFKGKVWKHGWMMLRGMKIRLAPYLFAGYCVVMIRALCRLSVFV